MSVGEQIREWRVRVDLSQDDLAQRLGVTQGLISQLERGAVKLTVERARDIAGVCGVSPSEWQSLLTESV